MNKHLLLTISALTTSAALGLGCGPAADDNEETATSESAASAGAPSAISRGAQLFLRPFAGTEGNGRACATCHVPGAAFQLTPAHVEARWQALQLARVKDRDADDPLFRAIDADDPNAASPTYDRLRQHALVRVKVKLPTDAQGNKLIWPVDDPSATEVEVFRSTPTIQNVAITGAYQLDGRAATLQDQALGALTGHAETKVVPKTAFLNDVVAFQQNQFSSPAVRALAGALASGQPAPPTDPALNAQEQTGKQLFEMHCTVCHGGPSGTTPAPGVPAFTDVMASRPLPPFTAGLVFADAPPLPVRLWAVRVGPADPVIQPSTDPGRALISGAISDFNTFDVPTMHGISKTAPYFHDNSAASLEVVVVHYQSFFASLARILPPEFAPPQIQNSDIAPLTAYLKKI